jgi:hypothetical protein
MPAATPIVRRRKAVTRLLKIHLRDYPEHVVAQAVRAACGVLTAQPGSAHRAILAGERYAKERMDRHALLTAEAG